MNCCIITNIFINYCNVTVTLHAYALVCFLVPLAPKQRKLGYLLTLFLQHLCPPPPPQVSATDKADFNAMPFLEAVVCNCYTVTKCKSHYWNRFILNVQIICIGIRFLPNPQRLTKFIMLVVY